MTTVRTGADIGSRLRELCKSVSHAASAFVEAASDRDVIELELKRLRATHEKARGKARITAGKDAVAIGDEIAAAWTSIRLLSELQSELGHACEAMRRITANITQLGESYVNP